MYCTLEKSLPRIAWSYGQPIPAISSNFDFTFGNEFLTFPYNLCVTPVPYGVIYGCGDLIFSSHMTFALTFCHTYNKYGTKRYVTSVFIDYQRRAWQWGCYESSFSLLKLVDAHLLSTCVCVQMGKEGFLGVDDCSQLPHYCFSKTLFCGCCCGLVCYLSQLWISSFQSIGHCV